jgi:hypothetical protein
LTLALSRGRSLALGSLGSLTRDLRPGLLSFGPLDFARGYRELGEYKLHAFVVMRDHFHVLLTIEGTRSIERVVQKIKGGFSHRARVELGFRGEIWQRGFTDERIWDADQFVSVRQAHSQQSGS